MDLRNYNFRFSYLNTGTVVAPNIQTALDRVNEAHACAFLGRAGVNDTYKDGGPFPVISLLENGKEVARVTDPEQIDQAQVIPDEVWYELIPENAR